MQLFKFCTPDNDQSDRMSQHGEGRKKNAHYGCSQLQSVQTSVVTPHELIIQKGEVKPVESCSFYSVGNATNTMYAVQRGCAYEGTFKLLNIHTMQVMIITLLEKIFKQVNI